MSKILHFCRPEAPDRETHFMIKLNRQLSDAQLNRLKWFLADDEISEKPFLYDGNGNQVVEIGPPPEYATANSTNLTQIFHNMGIPQVVRAEEFKRLLMPEDQVRQYVRDTKKYWTESWYKRPLKYFSRGPKPDPVVYLPLSEKDVQPLIAFNNKHQLGFDDWMLNWTYEMYKEEGVDPSDVSLFHLAQLLSSHSRHWEFSGKYFIDGVAMPYSPFELIKMPLKKNLGNSRIGFYDNSSAIDGYTVEYLMPERPGEYSSFVIVEVKINPTGTAESHNAPTGEEAFNGAGTGDIGMERDSQGTGRGGSVFFHSGGYCWPHLFLRDYPLSWEERPKKLRNAHPKDMVIESFRGYIISANENGYPCLGGFTRSLEMVMPDGRREACFKPVLYTKGNGGIFEENIKRIPPEIGDEQLRIGGPIYPTGVGGGHFSSQGGGALKKAIAQKAVQRVDPEMAQKNIRVTTALAEMRSKNPVKGIHDQGAGGLGACSAEAADPEGIEADLDQVSRGVENIPEWVAFSAEFQESNLLTVSSDLVEKVKQICERERCPMDRFAKYTGTGRMVVKSSKTGQILVDHNLKKVLGKLPQREYHYTTREEKLLPLDLPSMTIAEATKLIFSNVAVGSKGFLTNMMDRSVKGRTISQQCQGPMQIPIGDAAIFALSHNSNCGMTSALGEQPLKMMIDSAAGARMSYAEMLTNMAGVGLSGWADVKCSVNWMWAINFLGEGAALYRAVEAISVLSNELGTYCENQGMAQPDGGKDSLFLLKKLKNEIIKSFRHGIIGGYCTVPDLSLFVTPDIKRPGQSKLMYINPSPGRYRLGGSALAYCNKQLGNESPDIDDPYLFYRSLESIQRLVKNKLILSLHDRSDGGLITTASEMIMARNCGFDITLPDRDGDCEDPLQMLMAEEAGWICEYLPSEENKIRAWLDHKKVTYHVLGRTTAEKYARIQHQGKAVFEEKTPTLRGWWEATSHQMERQFRNPECADQRYERSLDRDIPAYRLTYVPKPTTPEIMIKTNKIKAAILREEGSNGDREMAEMAFMGGMEPVDVHMTDLVNGIATLDPFQVLLPVGGFANRDAGRHGKGWAATIRFNELAAATTNRFKSRKNTCSYNPCNAMQAFLYLGWAPFPDEPEKNWPRMEKNISGEFEHNWINVVFPKSKSVAFQGMEGAFLGIWSAHGGGRIYSNDPNFYQRVIDEKLVVMFYADDLGNPTELYPWDPNGSPRGIAGICSRDGRHTYTMPHVERVMRAQTGAWLPEEMQENLTVSYYLQVFQNLREFAEQHQNNDE
ncbi:MAG: phosphoribosylformylglycinamidine synthase [bacterium]|nr:phosphoribosylformylglycinamidine synthase [bacterium]